MKKNLQEYFDSANKFLDSQKLINQDDFQKLLESQSTNQPERKINIGNKLFQRRIVMSITGISVLIGLFYGLSLFNSNEPTNTAENKTQIVAETKSVTANDNTTKNEIITTLKNDADKPQVESFEHIVPIIRLNIDELKNLGFEKTDSGYVLFTEAPISPIKYFSNKEKLVNYGYNISDSTATFKEKYEISTFEFKKEILPFGDDSKIVNKFIFPIAFSKYFRKNIYSFGTISSSFAYDALVDDEAGKNVMKEIDRFKNQYILRGKLDSMNNDFVDVSDSGYSYITKLIPVYFTIGNPKVNGSENIIWYLANKDLINSLPDRYKNILIDKIAYVDRISASQNDKEEYAPITNVKKDINKTTDTLKALLLTNDELDRIGIKFDGAKYNVITEEYRLTDSNRNYNLTESKRINHFYYTKKTSLAEQGYDTTLNNILYRSLFTFEAGKHSTIPVKYSGWDMKSPLKISPIAISNYANYFEYKENFMKYTNTIMLNITTMNDSPLLIYLDSNNKDIHKEFKYKGMRLSTTLKKLIPVKITDNMFNTNDSSKLRLSETILWYVPTKEFIEALPERYRNDINNQLELLAQLEKGTITEDKACDALKGKDSYFDICRLGNEYIKNLQVYPNPITNNSFNMKFNLLKKVKLEFDLYDINGSHKTHLLSTTLSPGAIDIPQKISTSISDGIYIIIIKSEDGSQVATRVIVQAK